MEKQIFYAVFTQFIHEDKITQNLIGMILNTNNSLLKLQKVKMHHLLSNFDQNSIDLYEVVFSIPYVGGTESIPLFKSI